MASSARHIAFALRLPGTARRMVTNFCAALRRFYHEAACAFRYIGRGVRAGGRIDRDIRPNWVRTIHPDRATSKLSESALPPSARSAGLPSRARRTARRFVADTRPLRGRARRRWCRHAPDPLRTARPIFRLAAGRRSARPYTREARPRLAFKTPDRSGCQDPKSEQKFVAKMLDNLLAQHQGQDNGNAA